MSEKFYITVAIPYANAKPHIGYALECVYADVLARHWRSRGKEVFFLMGTDEHGQKMVKASKQEGKEPQVFADEMSFRYQALHEALHLTNDDFIRTTESRHEPVAQAFWKLSAENGDIYKKMYKGLYCIGCESFKTLKELVDGKCPDHKIAPEQVEEENYFFKLSAYTDKIIALYASQPEFIYPKTKFNEMKKLVQEEGLQDVSISRSRSMLNWGVPVPGDPDQVMYVWFDALTNYLTGIGYGKGEEWKKWWPADVHVIGKEINRFHSALWPAMLMSAGFELPKQIAVHGWITVDGQKMSKSIGNVLDPFELVEKYGTEPVRYFLMREIPFERDGDFSFQRFNERYAADLANDLGNLLSRTTTMIEKYVDGKINMNVVVDKSLSALKPEVQLKNVNDCIEGMRFDQALEQIWVMVNEGNVLIDREKPWVLAKENPQRLEQVLTQLVVYLKTVALALLPFLPETAHNIQQALEKERISKSEQLFPRLEKTI